MNSKEKISFPLEEMTCHFPLREKILVTGGTGLVGYAIQQICCNYKDKYDFVFIGSKDCNLLNLEETQTLFEKIKPSFVIHLAAKVGGLFMNMKYKVQMLEDNLIINYNVLKCCHDYNVKKVISCLSTCIFPDNVTYPITENMLHNGPPHNSNDAYAYSKRLLDIHSKAYREQYGHNYVCIIPTNIYGPNDNYNLDNAHVVPALIHKFYNAQKEGLPITISGTGKPLRQFIFSIDLAKLIMLVLEKYNESESIILAPNEEDEVSIQDMAITIGKCYNFDKDKIINDLTKSDGQYKKTVSNNKLKILISKDEFQFTSISEGIQKSVEWFQNNYEIARK